MKKHPFNMFFVGGIIFMIIIATLKYMASATIGILGLLAAFVFGGVLMVVAMEKKTSFLKNALFISAFVYLLYIILSPVQTIGNNWIINKTELLFLGVIFVMLIERDFVNSIRVAFQKEPLKGIGVLGTMALSIFVISTGILDPVWFWLGENTWVFILLAFGWFIFLFFLVNKGLKKAGDIILGLAGRK